MLIVSELDESITYTLDTDYEYDAYTIYYDKDTWIVLGIEDVPTQMTYEEVREFIDNIIYNHGGELFST